MIFDTAMTQACRDGRLPGDAAAVYEEVLKRLKDSLKETPLQRQSRVEKEFQDLTMGSKSHSMFQAQWERLLLDMQIAGVEIPAATTLFR